MLAAAAGGSIVSKPPTPYAGDVLQHPRRGCRAGARQQLDGPEARDPIARIFRPAQKCQHVLDVGCFKKFQPAEFYEWNVPPGQLDFERSGMMRRAKQHGLRLERGALFARLQNFLDRHSAPDRLRRERWSACGFLRRFSVRPQVLGEPLLRQPDDGVGGAPGSAASTDNSVPVSLSPPAA